MIAGLKGIIKHREPDRVSIDVNGVFYECLVSLSTLGALGEVGDTVELFVHTHVREDALLLFGFATMEEKSLFLAMTAVSGIGPKLAQNILSGLPADDLARAVVDGDVARLTRIPGVGKKTAERIVLELKEKLSKKLMLEPRELKGQTRFSAEDELVSALANLGYKPKTIGQVLEKLSDRLDGDARVEELIRHALKELQS